MITVTMTFSNIAEAVGVLAQCTGPVAITMQPAVDAAPAPAPVKPRAAVQAAKTAETTPSAATSPTAASVPAPAPAAVEPAPAPAPVEKPFDYATLLTRITELVALAGGPARVVAVAKALGGPDATFKTLTPDQWKPAYDKLAELGAQLEAEKAAIA